jgi:hypothetical protein
MSFHAWFVAVKVTYLSDILLKSAISATVPEDVRSPALAMHAPVKVGPTPCPKNNWVQKRYAFSRPV